MGAAIAGVSEHPGAVESGRALLDAQNKAAAVTMHAYAGGPDLNILQFPQWSHLSALPFCRLPTYESHNIDLLDCGRRRQTWQDINNK
jgi:hypothetical protein